MSADKSSATILKPKFLSLLAIVVIIVISFLMCLFVFKKEQSNYIELQNKRKSEIEPIELRDNIINIDNNLVEFKQDYKLPENDFAKKYVLDNGVFQTDYIPTALIDANYFILWIIKKNKTTDKYNKCYILVSNKKHSFMGTFLIVSK